MTDQQLDPYNTPGEPKRSVNWWLLLVGMTLFGIGDFFYFASGLDAQDISSGFILLGITIAGAAISFAVHRSLALGVVSGYVVMTIVSGGACTWTFLDPVSEGGGAIAGLLLYPLALLIVFIAAIVVTVRNGRRERS